MRNNTLHQKDGQWFVHWKGDDIALTSAQAASLQEQKDVQVPTTLLEGLALDWAVADVRGYRPHIQVDECDGTLLPGGRVTRSYDTQVVIAHFVYMQRFGPFRPTVDYNQGGPILDEFRISTEIAGDGWAALLNDCFSPETHRKAVKGPTRLLAGLRCLVHHHKGLLTEVPAELLTPELRLYVSEYGFMVIEGSDELHTFKIQKS